MIPPITREEKYMYEIVGAGETAPEKPLTRKEIFYAVILGEDRTVPRPITNEEKYLATLAGAYSETLPSPTTRIEKFLAKAAGMDVETPVPVTREEIFWDNYSAVQKFEGVPPLTFKGNGKVLKNYRIYGNTVEGKSVGDRTANLFANLWKKGYIRADNGREEQIDGFICSGFFPVEYGQTYSISRNILVGYDNIRGYKDDESFIGAGTDVCDVSNPFPSGATKIGAFTVTNENVAFVRFNDSANDLGMKYMIVEGTYTERTMPAYEPYGYRVPVAINNYTVTLYLPESLKMVGDEAEYVDYEEQKQYFADGSYANVTLPEIPTIAGTNTLSVDTQVQPSKVYVEVGIKTGGYTIYFYNGETLLETVTGVPSGGTATYTGATPTKESTQQYNYNFIGWNTDSSASTADADALKNVTANRSVYAIFEKVAKGYTVYFYNGDTLLQTVENVPEGGTATYTGATPTSSQAGYIFDGWNPSNTNITADTSCYAQFKEDEMYESITDTWAQIIANIGNGTYSTRYQVGDTKKIDLGTEGEIIMQVVGIDVDDLANNSGKAPITWISKQLLKTSHRMNPSYRSGTEGTGTLGGWEKAEMRSYLKETIKPLIPETVRNAIKPVKKYTRIYDVSETSVNNVLTTDDVWIPSRREVFGNYSSEIFGVYYSTAFHDNASRIKSKVGSSAAWWWLRSAYDLKHFSVVITGGSDYDSLANDVGGVALGFCT